MRAAPLYRPANVGLFGETRIDYAAAADSYSADVIAMSATVRRPFELDGARWVCVGTGGNFTTYTSIRIYKLTPEREFDGVARSYTGKCLIDGGEFARNDPNGFYHGMTVQHGGKWYALTGPEFELLAEPTEVRGGLYQDEDEELATVSDEDFELDYSDEDVEEYAGDQLTFSQVDGAASSQAFAEWEAKYYPEPEFKCPDCWAESVDGSVCAGCLARRSDGSQLSMF